jgi:hypothetical protein
MDVVLAGDRRLINGTELELVLNDHGVEAGSNRDDAAVEGKVIQAENVSGSRQIEVHVHRGHGPVELHQGIEPTEAAAVEVDGAVKDFLGGRAAAGGELEADRAQKVEMAEFLADGPIRAQINRGRTLKQGRRAARRGPGHAGGGQELARHVADQRVLGVAADVQPPLMPIRIARHGRAAAGDADVEPFRDGNGQGRSDNIDFTGGKQRNVAGASGPMPRVVFWMALTSSVFSFLLSDDRSS